MWARKLQELTDMGVIPDYRSAAAHAARQGGFHANALQGPMSTSVAACARQTPSVNGCTGPESTHLQGGFRRDSIANGHALSGANSSVH